MSDIHLITQLLRLTSHAMNPILLFLFAIFRSCYSRFIFILLREGLYVRHSLHNPATTFDESCYESDTAFLIYHF